MVPCPSARAAVAVSDALQWFVVSICFCARQYYRLFSPRQPAVTSYVRRLSYGIFLSCTVTYSSSPSSFMAGNVIPPPYVITEHDKRGLIVVTGASVLAFVWCCSLIRLWLRWQLKEWRSDGEYLPRRNTQEISWRAYTNNLG